MTSDSLSWTVFHHAGCGTSRNAVALLRHAGVEPRLVDLAEAPPDAATLKRLIARLGLTVREALREREPLFEELGLDDPTLTADELIEAARANPTLIQRPLVVAPGGASLCRPSDLVLDLLPTLPDRGFVKDDGTPVLADAPIEPGPELVDALMGTHLLVDDLQGSDRTFYRFRLLDGPVVGYGGFELYGSAMLLRSMAVPTEQRGQGIGRAIARRLLRRAFDRGARRAYAVTTTATPFFLKLGFHTVERTMVPPAILASKEAAGLHPSNTALLGRRIRL